MEVIVRVLLRTGRNSRKVHFPSLTAIFTKDPTNLSQLRLLLQLVKVVDPEVQAAIITNLLLNLDSDRLLATLDVLGAGGGRDRPIGPVISTHCRQTRRAFVEFDAGLDPLGFATLARHGEEETSLVVLVDVGAGECDGDVVEVGQWLLAEELLRGCKISMSCLNLYCLTHHCRHYVMEEASKHQ